MRLLLSLLILFYLLLASYEDIRTKTMDMRLFGIFCFMLAVIVLAGLSENIISCLYGSVPGILLLLVSLGSKGQIGAGDAALVTALGFAVGLFGIMEILFIAWAGAFVTAAVFMIKKKRNRRFAFIPFLAGGYYLSLFFTLSGGL